MSWSIRDSKQVNSRRGYPPGIEYPTNQVFESVHTLVQHAIPLVMRPLYTKTDDERFHNWATSAHTQMRGHKDHTGALHGDVLERQIERCESKVPLEYNLPLRAFAPNVRGDRSMILKYNEWVFGPETDINFEWMARSTVVHAVQQFLYGDWNKDPKPQNKLVQHINLLIRKAEAHMHANLYFALEMVGYSREAAERMSKVEIMDE